MAKKKMTTAEILAAARAQDSGGKPDSEDAAPAEEKPAAAAKKPAAPGKKPTSTADILAAARASAAGGSAAPAAEEKSSPKAAAKAPDKAKSSGPKPSVQEMLKAVREGKSTEEVAAADKPRVPQIPTKPAAAKKAAAAPTRRNVLVSLIATPFAIAWTSLGATCTAAVLGVARFMFPNVLVEPPTRFKIGPPSDYPLGTVSTKWKAARGIWIVHTDQYKGKNLVYALASVCTHLGCTPNWLEGEQKFKCPCHGSGFYVTGVNFEGPAPRPLERVGLSIAPDGMLEVDKSVKFQEEMGQWEDASSFVDGTIA